MALGRQSEFHFVFLDGPVVTNQVNQGDAVEHEDLSQDLVIAGLMVIWWRFAVVLESWMCAVQGGDGSLQGNLEHDEGWVVGLGKERERKDDLRGIHVVAVKLGLSV